MTGIRRKADLYQLYRVQPGRLPTGGYRHAINPHSICLLHVNPTIPIWVFVEGIVKMARAGGGRLKAPLVLIIMMATVLPVCWLIWVLMDWAGIKPFLSPIFASQGRGGKGPDIGRMPEV
jgi:hypothetical protein